MAQDNDFLKIMIKDVTFHWPRLDQPYRYNSQEKRTEACAATVTGAGYSIAWDMPKTEAKDLFTALKAHYNKVKETKPKLPPFSQVFGMKKDEEAGTVRFTAKKRAVSSTGEINKPPRVVNGQLVDIPHDEKAIWSGSRGCVRVRAFPTTDPDGAGGISLLLDTVQVVEAVYGGDNLEDDFDRYEAPQKSLDDMDEEPRNSEPKQSAKVPEDAEW